MSPHPSARTASHALIDVSPLVSHHDLSALVADLAGCIKANKGLSDKCRRSVIEQLDELADEIDQDLRNQQEEQEWREAEGRRLAA